MTIPINSLCIECHLRKRLSLARELGTEEQAMELAHKIMQELLKAPADMDSTWLGSISDKLMQDMYGIDQNRLAEEKEITREALMRITKSDVRCAVYGREDLPEDKTEKGE